MLFTRYILFLIFVASVAIGIWLIVDATKRRKREKLYKTPLKDEWLRLLKKHVPLSNKLPAEYLEIYHGHINYFLATKEFVGRGGYVIDDKTKITIAGNACLLVLTRKNIIYPGFKTIIVYPQTYQAPSSNNNDGGIVEQSLEKRAGESWYRGPIVLSWSDVEFGSNDTKDAHNVVIHEFAHKLDEETQLMDGLPILKDRSHYQEWATVLTKEFEEFLTRVSKRSNKVIDSYGAVSAVEFFAVITESFFEKPWQMKRELPELYQQLSRYYGVDAAEW